MKKRPSKALVELMLADLARSGLTEKDSHSMGLEILDADRVTEMFPYMVGVSAYKIPYYDVRGKMRPEIYRLRLLGEQRGAFGEVPAKPRRYLQPPETPPAAYFPPLFDWSTVEAHMPVIITEGEKKAATACKMGLPAIGLGGVSSWKSNARGWRLLPELEAYPWLDRDVCIIFDSDIRTNTDIARSASALAAELRDRGAKPKICELPDIMEGGKTGLDDFLRNGGGTAALSKITSATPNDDLAIKLWDYNARFVYVENPSVIHENETHTLHSPTKFINETHSNDFAVENYEAQSGERKTKKTPVAAAWMKWPQRRQVRGLSYRPGQGPLTDAGEINLWFGWGCVPKQGDISPWKDLLDLLFVDSDEVDRQWFENWCLYPIRHPGVKQLSAVGMWSKDVGQGKSLVGHTLGKIYGQNFCEIGQKTLDSNFNGWAVNKQFVLVDEVTAYDSRSKADLLKQFITQETIHVSIKYLPEYSVPDCCNIYLTSNRITAFFVEDRDRRWFIHEVKSARREKAFYDLYHEWRDNGGPSHLLWYAQNEHDFGKYSPKAEPPTTQAKLDMVHAVKSELDQWIADVVVRTDVPFRLGHNHVEQDVVSASDALAAYNVVCTGNKVTPPVMSNALAANCQAVPGRIAVYKDSVQEKFFIVRRPEIWLSATRKQIIEHIREAREKRGVKH